MATYFIIRSVVDGKGGLHHSSPVETNNALEHRSMTITQQSQLLDIVKTELLRARDPRNERPHTQYVYVLGLIHGARLGEVITADEHANLFALAKNAAALSTTKRPFPVTGKWTPF